jgi:hypothetical protein
MSDYNYEKHLSGGTTYQEGSAITCATAKIYAVGTFLSAPTFTGKGFECDSDATVVSDSSATIVIEKLAAKTVTLRSLSSGTVVIGEIEAETVDIEVDHSSTLRIEDGAITHISGVVKNASTGVCRASIERDDITLESASTWDTKKS